MGLKSTSLSTLSNTANMHLLALISVILLDSLAHCAALPQNKTDACANSTWTQPKLSIGQVMANWGQVWKANFTVLNQTVTPDVAVWQDRVPTPGPAMLNGTASNPHIAERLTITNQAQLVEFVKTSHKGFAEYGFVNQFYFVNDEGNKLVTRWALDAIVGEDTTST